MAEKKNKKFIYTYLVVAQRLEPVSRARARAIYKQFSPRPTY